MNKLKAKIIAWLNKDENLIYTSKGNLPIKSLERKVEWHFSVGEIVFKEIYLLDGEVVKEGADVYLLPEGTELYIKQGQLS